MPDSIYSFCRRQWRWLVLAFYWLFLLAMTSLPGTWLRWPPPKAGRDKIFHFLAYAGLGLLFFVARQAGRSSGSFKTLGLVLLFICLYAAFDEWHQQFIPGRFMDSADFIADMLGGAAGAAAGLAVYHLRSPSVSLRS